MSEDERRHETRIPIELWIEEESDGASYFQHSANLSRGGLFLDNSVPHPVGTSMQIRFTLPGDGAPIQTKAVIVQIEAHGGFGMHLKFDGMATADVARIDNFIASAQES
jgi:uncharacterized protein (TIGR02266 family)